MSYAAYGAPRADEDFGARLNELIPNLRAFAKSLCGGRDGAEDLAQDSVMSAWKARASFEPGTNLKAWLFVIQRNAFYSLGRKKRPVQWNEAEMEKRLVADPGQQASAELTDLARAMSSLPREQCEALILVGAGGFSHQHAAAMRGCATGTMKSRVSRARAAVTKLLEQGACLPALKQGADTAYDAITRELAALSAAPRASIH